MTKSLDDHRRVAARGPALLALVGGAGAALALVAAVGLLGRRTVTARAVGPAPELAPRAEIPAQVPEREAMRAVLSSPPLGGRGRSDAAAVAAARFRDSGGALDAPTERELIDAYLLRARADAAALEAQAPALLLGDAPDREKLALLLALHAAGTPRAEELVLSALRDLPDERDGARASVPEVLVRRLGQRAGRDPAAARTLLAALSTGALSERPALRRRAAALLATFGTTEHLDALDVLLAQEADESVVEAARNAASARRGETNESG